MAITYNTFFNELSTTYNIETGKSFMNLSTPMKRNIPYPVDRYSVFSSFDELSAYYTNNPVVYPGQVVTVVNDNNTVDLYTLDYENNNIFEVTADTGAITSAQTLIPKRIDSLTTIDNIETDLSSLTYKPSYLYTNNTQEIYVPIPDSDYSQVSSWISLTSQKFYSADKSANLIVDSNYGRAKLTAKTGQEWFTIDTGIEFTGAPENIQGIKQVYYAKEGCYYICTSTGLYRTYNTDLSDCERIHREKICRNANNPDGSSCVYSIIEIAMQEYLLVVFADIYNSTAGGSDIFYYNSYTDEVKNLSELTRPGWCPEHLILQNNANIVEIVFTTGSIELVYIKIDKQSAEKTTTRKILDNITVNGSALKVTQHIARYNPNSNIDDIYITSHYGGNKPSYACGLLKISYADLRNAIDTDNNVAVTLVETFRNTVVYNVRILDILTIEDVTRSSDGFTNKQIVKNNTLFIACDSSAYETSESINNSGNNGIFEYDTATSSFMSLSAELPFNKARDIYKTDYIDKDENGIPTIDTNWYFVGYNDTTPGNLDNIGSDVSGYVIYSANITNETNPNGMWRKTDIVNSGYTIGNESYPELTEIKGYITVNSKINTSSITYISPAPASPYLANLSDIPVLGVKVNNKVQEIDENGFVKITRTNVTHSYTYTDVSSTCPSAPELSSVLAVGEKIALNTYNNIEEYDISLRLKSITLYCPDNITENAQLTLNLYTGIIATNGTLTGGKLIAKSANVVEYASNNEMTFEFDNDIIELSRNSVYTITLFDANTNNVKQVSLVSYNNPDTSNGNLIITNATGTNSLIDISYNSFDTGRVLQHKLNFIAAGHNNAEIFVEKTQVATIKDVETLEITLSTNIENLETVSSNLYNKLTSTSSELYTDLTSVSSDLNDVSGNAILTKNITLTGVSNVGALSNGDIISAGTSLTDILSRMLQVEQKPTIVQPCIKRGDYTTKLTLYKKIGTALSSIGSLTATYTDGTYDNDPTTTSNDISSANAKVSAYFITYENLNGSNYVTVNESSATTATSYVLPYDKSNIDYLPNTTLTYTIKCYHDSGDTIISNTGIQHPAGTDVSSDWMVVAGYTNTLTTDIIGYRPYYYGTLNRQVVVDELSSNEATLDFLESLTTSTVGAKNDTKFDITIPTGAMSVIIAYISSIRNVSEVIDKGGMNANIADSFIQNVITRTVNSENNYDKVTYKIFYINYSDIPTASNTYNVKI